MKISAFVISLERAVERRPHAGWIESNVPLPCVSLSAVDGTAMTAEAVDGIYKRQIHDPRYPHVLRRGEIGCFLSHRKAWQAIVDQKLDAALILEDDVTFDADCFSEAINFVTENMVAGDYVQFQVRDVDSSWPVVVRDEKHSLIQPRPAPLRTTAQIVTRAAAQRLLELTTSIDRPVDAFLQLTWVTGVPIKVVLPRVVSEISQQIGGSTLGGKGRPWHERLRREILRPIYRAQIRFRARKAA
jgi:GR25 family glycosyltransferase involved in LPS biosynthesis